VQVVEKDCAEIKANAKVKGLSNIAKLLLAYMEITGTTCAKTIAAKLDIPVRTIQRLKLDCATATDGASSAIEETPLAPYVAHVSEPTTATSATDGVFDAPLAPDMAFSPSRVLDNNKLTSLADRPENNKNPLPPTKTKGPGASDALIAFEAYNATALECALPQAAKLTPDRQRKIIARLKDYGLDGWKQALTNIERSSFLTGTNERGWRASLDFLLQPASFAKVHDGGYGNGRHAAKQAAKVEYHYPAWYLEEKASMGGVA
jgi:hypothetical protein